MLQRQRGWGISHALVLLLLVTLAPFIVLEVYRGAQDVQHRREAVAQQERNQAVEAAQITNDFLGFTGRFLASLADTPPVQARDAAGSQALFEAIRRQHPNYESVFLFGSDGTETANATSAFRDLQIMQRPYVRQALATGQMTISDVTALPQIDRSVVVLAYPVSSDDDARIGVIGIALRIGRLSSVIGYVRLPAGSTVLLVQQDGSVIASSSDPETWIGQTLTGVKSLSPAFLSRHGGTTKGRLPDGIERLVAYEPVKDTPWFVLAGIPQAELDTALRESLLRVSEAAALAVLATVLLAWLMLRRIVVPIRMLSDGARAFAAGFLDRRIPVRRRDELGALADALNSMAAALQERLDADAAHAEALEALNRLQAEFVATASHELRTPVTAIRTYAEALLRPDIDDEAIRRECLEGIDHSSRRLAQLVRALLDVSRIDSDGIKVHLEPVDALAMARAAIAQTDPEADHDIAVRTAPHLPPVQADAERLEDVLANLAGNAIKFSPPGSPVVLDIWRTGAELLIAVRDQGPGIAPEELPRVFDRFYQVDRGTGRRAGGSGLGLYIARAYVLAMGGRIWAESTPARGSSFFVALPVVVDPIDRLPDGSIDGHAVAAPSR